MHTPLAHRPGRWLWLATLSLAMAGFVALSLNPVHAQEAAAPRLKTESPYFFVKSDDPSIDRLPLKGTEVSVKISGVIADVTVTQLLPPAAGARFSASAAGCACFGRAVPGRRGVDVRCRTWPTTRRLTRGR